jgi:hypothetical protein
MGGKPMRDSIPPPSPKGKPKRSKLPAAIADQDTRVPISSIAAYQEMTDGKLSCFLKSGETITLDFDVSYLSKKAMAILDAHFNIEQPVWYACDVCLNKDKIDPEESNGRTFCDFCYKDREYFKSPTEAE